ncbi:hemin-degrading factor [Dickeya solani]|uniref:ChuX/HutX family heme-like substrate-binding protein n=1 Tax=Dickeya solani TaxID=1089444 RepID=A0AAX4EV25_9GAMM|nr:ChuX/HutX family heme-like substrate-binding protein [Dickeya solani]WOA50862.1 ChuX/HutX family heme-like substrate-binding protein [Dickeya solani]
MHHHYTHYLQLKVEHPRKYARDVARMMGLSEAELTSLRVGHDARRLSGDTRALLAGLESVGETKSITRNEYAVHEQVGVYRNQRIGEHVGLVLNPRGLDLRLFPEQWGSAFALTEQTARGERHSIQFFDRHGDAVLKVYATDNTELTAWLALIARFTLADNPPLALQPAPVDTPVATLDAALLEQEWRAMTDVHQFFPLLKRHQITRPQAFRAVSDDLACQVDNQALGTLLRAAQQAGNEIMIFVGNRGCVQIFTGVIEKVTPMENWLNVFNRDFTLHLVEDAIAESWVTRKPTNDGMVTSLELFAADGTPIAQLFGQRSEGEPEQTRWREQVMSLVTPEVAA